MINKCDVYIWEETKMTMQKTSHFLWTKMVNGNFLPLMI